MSKSKKKIINGNQINFNKPLVIYPPHEEFPLNVLQNTVSRIVSDDISTSTTFLVVTGFTSLGHIIDFFGSKSFEKLNNVRIILGWAPDERVRKNIGTAELDKEIKDYWLERGYSIANSGAVIKIIELIKNDYLQFRFLDKLHAKIYIADEYAILGSSNFSKSGLTFQMEANIRVNNNLTNEFEKKQYENISLIANNFYNSGKDYKDKILELLANLLKITTWQEALARAITELIDRNWFKDFPELYTKLNSLKLWPSQRLAIGEALYILQTQGCVLIAEPTGSGKTKLISTLTLILFHWLWETGRKDKTYTLTICPPLVKDNWKQEAIELKFAQNSHESMGILSYTESKKHVNLKKELKIANILVIDEAHNYLNIESKRSQSISEHIADQIILSTATPINKKAKDLIRLIDLLGVDNLSDDENNNQLEHFKQLKKLKFISKKRDLEELKKYIDKFIVRRTKFQLSKLIEQEPEKYHNKFGKPCKYPKQVNDIYLTGEKQPDIDIARKIDNLVQKLNGIIYLQRIEKPEYDFEIDEDIYIQNRLNAAKYLAIYNIRSKIRSSKAAIIEHIEGTHIAKELFQFKTTKTDSGNIIDKLTKLKPIKYDFKKEQLPIWITDFIEYQKVCENEIYIYKQIAELSKKLTDDREHTKIKKIIDLFETHQLVIAFDSAIITLDYFNKILKMQYPEIDSFVIIGNTDKSSLLAKFQLGETFKKKTLILCSDTLSEGVNLQIFSAMVFLDMPSVLRIAEQRIGRIDRLDSPHEKVEIYWPFDSDEFALKTDRKLVRTLLDAESLIGNNFVPPVEIMDKHLNQIIRPDEMINELKKAEQEDYIWSGIQDAFRPVHDLYDNENAIIPKATYLQFLEVGVDIKVKLSIGENDTPWFFIALRGDKSMSPRWFLIDEKNKIHSDLGEICAVLRVKIASVKQWRDSEQKWLKSTSTYLNNYLTLLQKNERNILPNKRKRALKVAEKILNRQYDLKDTDKESKDIIYSVLRLFKPISLNEDYGTNFYMFSQLWLDKLNPLLALKRSQNKMKNKVICLNDLLSDKSIRFTIKELEEIRDNAPLTRQIWHNVASCIIAIPKSEIDE